MHQAMSLPEQPESAASDRPSPGQALRAEIAAVGARRERARNLRPLRALLPFVWRSRGDLLLAVTFLLMSTATTLGLAEAGRLLVDRGLAPDRPGALATYFGLLGGVAVLLAVCTSLRFFFVTKLGERTVADLRRALYDHVLALSPGFFAKTRTGEIIARLTTDTALLETFVGSSASIALRNLLSLCGAVLLLFLTNPALTALVFLTVPAILGPLFWFGGRLRRLTVKAQDLLAGATAYAGESIDAIDSVQAFGQENWSRGRFAEAIEVAFSMSLKRMRARAIMTGLFITLVFGGIVLVLFLAAQAVQQGDMSGGELLRFVFLSILAASSVAALGETFGDAQKAAGAMQRIAEILAETPDIAAPAAPVPLPDPPQGEIVLEDVHFAYPGLAGPAALNGLSLRVRPGETVALVGPSGAGKSTVFKLLLRFYDPTSGAVRLDGVDARHADPQAWRSRFSYVSQDQALFTGSAAENIRFGRRAADDAAVREAALRAEALGFLEVREGGLDAPLGDRARRLSGGERQRLSLARALVRDAPILLLDEATSALDAESERLVQHALETAMSGRTTLVIAHRLATVLKADRICVIVAGRVVEEGAHADLVARGGVYARLAAIQFAVPEAS